MTQVIILTLIRKLFNMPQPSITYQQAIALAYEAYTKGTDVDTEPWIAKYGLRYCHIDMHNRNRANTFIIVDLVEGKISDAYHFAS